MNKIKKILKSVLGVYFVFVVKEKIHKLFKTNYYKEQIEFEKKSIKFYSGFICENDLVFDVGANFGNRIKTFLALNAKVTAVEPQPACCKYLKNKYGDRINLIEKAVGAKNQVKQMFMSNNSAISSFSEEWINSVKQNRYNDQEWKKGDLIEQTTLDDLIEKFGNPSFIKIDVEGYESEVIKGLNKETKLISFEYTVPEQKDKAIECINHLKLINKSVECNYSLGESMEFQLQNWISDSEIIELIQSNDFPTEVGDIYLRKKY